MHPGYHRDPLSPKRRPRMSSGDVRETMLSSAMDMVERRGLTVSLQHIPFDDIIARTPQSTISFPRRTRSAKRWLTIFLPPRLQGSEKEEFCAVSLRVIVRGERRGRHVAVAIVGHVDVRQSQVGSRNLVQLPPETPMPHPA